MLKSKSVQLRKVEYIAQDYAQKGSGHFEFFVILYEFNSGPAQICFLRRNPKYSLNFPLEALLGSTKTQKKRYNRVAKEIDNTQVQRKQKKTERNWTENEKK